MQLWKLGSPTSAARTSRQRSRRADLADKAEGSLPENLLFLEESNIFILFRLSTDWMSPTHIMKSNLLTNLNINLIEKHPIQHMELTIKVVIHISS